MTPVLAIISQVKTTADNTLKITVSFNELSPEQEAQILALRNRPGMFNFIAD